MINKLKIENWKLKIPAKRAGFSLIELLIVIAIIGILSTIILNSLSTSRVKAYDSKVKQQLSSFRTAAELYFSNTGNYGIATSDCSDTSFFNELTPANGAPGRFIDPANIPLNSVVVCQSTGSAYAVKISLYLNNQYWCVDSKGASMLGSGVPALGTVCP